MSASCKYPHITVKLVGGSGNAFAIIGGVRQALRRARISHEEIEAFTAEAKSGDYDHLLYVATQWVTVE